MAKDILERYLERKEISPFVVIAFCTLSIVGAVWEELVGIWNDYSNT